MSLEYRYIVVDEPVGNTGDEWQRVFLSLDDANADAARQWERLTSFERKKRHIYVAIVTPPDQYDWAVDGDGNVDWCAWHQCDLPAGAFDSSKI